jgi:G3E family GTPase
MTIPSPIPITVFTGFLGAGKTSIILSLLPKLPKDYKVVLLKNEFGDIEGARIYVSSRGTSSEHRYQWIANLPNNPVWQASARY